ncbi:spatacsin [Brevipalpus obovatus]|uniref:spatacsin n=1 Tax=Brevipalpus obovatus TaxID=246614 RepID=UPI003D9E9D66
MEFAVLEICLKNRQISNVDYFLKLQIKTFQSNWEKICSSLNGPDGDYRGLFQDWKQAFGLVLIIINTTLNGENNPPKEREFGLELTKLSLITCAALLKILLREEPNSFVNIERERFSFINFLINQVNSVMNSIGTVIHEYERLSKDPSKASNSWAENLWHKIKNQQILIPMNEFLVILAHYYKTFHMKDRINWNQINDIAFQAILNHLRANELDQVRSILVSLNLPSETILDNILDYAFTEQLRLPLTSSLKERDPIIFDRLSLLEKVNKPYGLRLCFKSIKIMQPNHFRDLLAHGVFQDSEELRKLCSKYIDPRQIWNYLIRTNNAYRMKKWIREHYETVDESQSNVIPAFSADITPQMVDDLTSDAQDDLREEILSLLSNYGIFSTAEVHDIRKIIRRLLRSQKDKTKPILLESASHPLKNPHSRISFHNFQKKVVSHCVDNSSFQILYWLIIRNDSKELLRDIKVDPKLQRLLSIFTLWNKDPTNNYATLKASLEVAYYLYDLDPSLNLQSLLARGHEKLAVLASLFAPKGILSCLEGNEDEIWFTQQESLLRAVRKHYPILFEAIAHIEDLKIPPYFKENNDSPSLYDLLADTIPLNISRLFCWQSTNVYRNMSDDSLLKNLPHFSHPELVELHGLSVDLSFTYYLKRGRPFEAYSKCLKNFPSSNIDESTADLCKSATRLAFDNCTNVEVTSACVIFLELFRNDTSIIRLHLAIGSLILKFSAKFLGLDEKSQASELGNLLKKAFFNKEQRAITHLMELLTTAFARKYPNECSMDELAAYQIPLDFSRLYRLDLPLNYLTKCLDFGDWLMYAVFAQHYEYPKDIICKQLSGFSGCIPEHLEKAFNSTSVTSERVGSQPIIGRRVNESRDTLYTRLGLVKGMSIRKTPTSTVQLAHSIDDDRSSVMSEDVETASIASSSMTVDFPSGIELDAENPPKDLFNLILVCQRNYPTQPSKSLLASSIILSNPIPALVAASLSVFTSEFEPPYSIFDCFCCWLFASFDMPSKTRRLTDESNQIIIWNQHELTALLQSALLHPPNFLVLRNGFQLFCRGENPLSILIDFFVDFLVEKHYHQSVAKLTIFQDNLREYRRPHGCGDVLTQKSWIEQTSMTIIRVGLEASDSFYELHILLRHMDSSKIQSVFSSPQVSVPDFRKIYRLSQTLKDTGITLDISDLLESVAGNERYRKAVLKIIYELQSKSFFNEAHLVANIMEIDKKQVHINEWSLKLTVGVNIFSLWRDCFQTLDRFNVDTKVVLELIERFSPQIESELTQVYVLAKKTHCALRLKLDQNFIKKVERELWTSIINFYKDNKLDETEEWNSIRETIMETYEKNWNELKQMVGSPVHDLAVDDEILGLVIGKILDEGRINLSNRVAHLFQHHNIDLELVNFCHLLAERFLEPDAIKVYIQSSITESKIPELGEVATLIEESDLSNSLDVVRVLEKCESLARHAMRAVKRIVLYYKISFAVGKRYVELSREHDELIILQNLIKRIAQSSEAFSLGKELVTFAEISDDSVADLIINETVSQLREDIENSEFPHRSIVPTRSESGFLSLIRLVNDPSSLGRKFLEILKNDIQPIVAVEICIKSHECFSLCCDIEGISSVLRNARYLVNQYLLPTKNHQAMIRLLTGIGRYSEMSYIFDILKENHQFELLLRKGYQKINQLRVALLDYLKNDREMYPLIALNFSMHREIAEMLESNALRSLRSINLRRSQNFMSFKHDLENIMQELIDASESYKKAGVFSRSDLCDKMAQLIALQINFLPLGNVIINMNENVLIEFITKHPKFIEALIVADAYQNQRHWNMALFQNVILRGDWNYYREYQATLPLNSNHIEGIFNIYTKWKAANKAVVSDVLTPVKANLHKLLKKSTDIVQSHRYLQELGFLEAANNLMKNVDGAYLRDLKRQGSLN